MGVTGRWSTWRTHGPEQLAVTLGFFLAGFFLLPTSKALNNVYYALVLAPALFLLRATDWRWLAGSTVWRFAMLLSGYLTLSGLWSAGFTFKDWLHEAKALPYLVVYLAVLACVCVRQPIAWERLLRAVVLAAVVGTLVSAALFYRAAPWTARLGFYGAVYNANEAATLAGGCLMLVLFHILPAERVRWRQGWWLLVAVVLATGILLTGSRMPLAAAVVCTGLGFALLRQWRLLGLLLAAFALMIGLLLADGYDYRQSVERSDAHRLAIWQQFSVRVAAQPWVGEGILTDDSTQVESRADHASPLAINHPHSVYLATALYGGLPALGLLAVLVGLALRQGMGLALREEPAWLLVLLLGLLCMLTDGDRLLHAPRGIWFYFWLPVGVLLARQAQAVAAAGVYERGSAPDRLSWSADRSK